MTPTDWPAPAKLNLFLHVVGRRPDGYHRLQTVFQFLDYGDTVRVTPRTDGAIRIHHRLEGLDPEQDLVARAAHRLQTATGATQGADLTVTKRLPAGGGLGGGSSDAATTLVALNRLWETGLDEEALARLGLELGADVPVFVRGQAAWAEEVGEALTPVELPEPWFLVVVPPVAVSTAAIFADPELNRAMPPITMDDYLAGRGGNALEAVVAAREPEVAAALEWLGAFAPARMTGSGACLFAAFDQQPAAEAVAARLPTRWSGFVARGCNRSPLLDGEWIDYWGVAKR
ncbi:4-(cytidine 5'-diphospho)-2-C-methyl-D-erythritol kinase [Thiohalospira halophila]|uniref:4-(cytidine 5'-diphospho)-2-C-methyl-D-erythritol kinase n=1 Tax=Thiohalospira halophila TaxID=381300 RepID=UPI000AE1E0B5|nr:4-(cytidine 5'-diphospho)-2-C-methyl-D-erythritol kinase [Thiohalospira halophila]